MLANECMNQTCLLSELRESTAPSRSSLVPTPPPRRLERVPPAPLERNPHTLARLLAMAAAQPKSILKKRPRAAVDPVVEEQPVAPGQQPSDAPVHVPSDEGDDDDDDEDSGDDAGTEEEFSAGSDDETEGEGDDEDDEEAIRDMMEDGQERPAKSASSGAGIRSMGLSGTH